MYLEAITFPIGYIVLIFFFLILGFILEGFYIIPEWIRVPVLQLGQYKGLKGPGIFWLMPLIYSIPYALDLRIITSSFSAEKTLTKDNVPVNVDAGTILASG